MTIISGSAISLSYLSQLASSARNLGRIHKISFQHTSQEDMWVPMPTHCTIACFGFRARRIDGVECGLFSIHAPLGRPHYVWGEYMYSVLQEVEVRMTICVTFCVV